MFYEEVTLLLHLKDTHQYVLVGNTECNHNFCLFSRKRHRAQAFRALRTLFNTYFLWKGVYFKY